MLTQAELDYIGLSVAKHLEQFLKADDEIWISQNKAWKRHGGRAFVTNLHRTGKVATRKVNNQIQYYQPDLAKHSAVNKIIKNAIL